MSRVPMGSNARGGTGPFPPSFMEAIDGRLWTQFRVSQVLADRYGITRQEMDAYALESHRRAAESWDNCSEANGPLVEVWRMTDSLPVREWQLKPYACANAPPEPWGFITPRWHGPDTLELTRIELLPGAHDTDPSRYSRQPVFAARASGGWRLLPH